MTVGEWSGRSVDAHGRTSRASLEQESPHLPTATSTKLGLEQDIFSLEHLFSFLLEPLASDFRSVLPHPNHLPNPDGTIPTYQSAIHLNSPFHPQLSVTATPPYQYTNPSTMAEHDEELVASKTEGFKVGEKKTIAEYNELGM